MRPAGVTFHEDAAVPFFAFDALAATGRLRHGFSTRLGGVSPAPYDSLNLGVTTKDAADNVRENRRCFVTETGLPLVDGVSLEHGIAVHYEMGAGERSRPRQVHPRSPTPDPRPPIADAIITDRPGVPITLYYADCCPVFVLDPAHHAVGLAHAGWRGTADNVAGSMLAAMQERFGTRPADCLAGIASSIGPCCFEVDWDVAGRMLQVFPQWEDLVSKTSNKWLVDLWEINARLLESAGVRPDRISVSRLCTACRPDLFFSFRRDRRMTGRMASTCVLLEEVSTSQ
ncbi:MAG: peptidoglycan editing factor PgeF [Candidatus Xenobia bacterium]